MVVICGLAVLLRYAAPLPPWLPPEVPLVRPTRPRASTAGLTASGAAPVLVAFRLGRHCLRTPRLLRSVIVILTTDINIQL